MPKEISLPEVRKKKERGKYKYKFDVDRKDFEKTHIGWTWSPQNMILQGLAVGKEYVL